MWKIPFFSGAFCFLLFSTFISDVAASPFPITRRSPAPFSTFNDNLVFQPPSNYKPSGTLYGRSVELPDGTILTTWENYSPEPPEVYFPIFKSTDGGATFAEFSQVHDQVNGWGLRYQPFLYLLTEPFGGYAANTILLAGNSIPSDVSQTRLELYASTDMGKTWEFVSHIALGGEALPNNGLTPVWEPSLMLHPDSGVLICYYSDQRDPKHGQKLVQQSTSDLRTWGAVVDVVAYPTYTDRPGMPIVAYLGYIDGKKQYMMTYEYGGGPVLGNVENSTTGAIGPYTGNYTFPVYYKMTDDPVNGFGHAVGVPLISNEALKVIPVGSPYVVAVRARPHDATPLIIVNCGTLNEIFVNHKQGDPSAWERKTAGAGESVSYTRSLALLDHDPPSSQKGGSGWSDWNGGPQKRMLITGGGPGGSKMNNVTVGVIDITGY